MGNQVAIVLIRVSGKSGNTTLFLYVDQEFADVFTGAL